MSAAPLPLRTALLTWDWPPAPTGLGRAAFEIACGLEAQGADVTVFDAGRPVGARDSGPEGFAGTVIGAGAPTGFWRRRMGVGHLVAPLAFRRAVAAEHARAPFDLIEATNWYAPAALVAGIAPLVVRNSTPAIDAFDASASLRDRADLRIAHLLEARTARRAAGCISNTQPHAQNIEKLYALRSDRPHEVIGLSLADETIARGAAAHAPAFGDTFEMLFVGRAERRKGFDAIADLLVRLAAGEAADLPRMHLHLVGLEEAEVRDALPQGAWEAGVHRLVRVHGRCDDGALLALMERVHGVLAPSRYESYGLVYREAAAFGRTLLACAEDPSARAFLAEVDCGVLADTCTGSALLDAYRRIATDPDRWHQRAQAGRTHATTLSRNALGRRTLGFYRSVLQSAPARRKRPWATSPSQNVRSRFQG